MIHGLFDLHALAVGAALWREILSTLLSDQPVFIGAILKEWCQSGEPYLLARGRVFRRRSGYLPADSAIFRLRAPYGMVCEKELRQYAS
jgi:hypothetical protein